MGDPSGGGEGLLFAFAGVLSLKELKGERERVGERGGEREREKSEPSLGGVVHRSVASIISLLHCPDM